MATILKISEATSLALHAMVYIAAYGIQPISTAKLAKELDASAAHLSKVMQRLTHIGLLKSHRGPSGGFLLTKPANKITLLEIYEAIEGPMPDSTCLFDKTVPVCTGKNCVLSELIKNVHNEVKKYLNKTTIDKQSIAFK